MRSDHYRWPIDLGEERSPFAASGGPSLTVLVELSVPPAAQRDLAEAAEAPGWIPARELAGWLAEVARREPAVGRALEAAIHARTGDRTYAGPPRSVAALASAWAELRGAWDLVAALGLLSSAARDSSVAARKLELAMAFELRQRAWRRLSGGDG